MPTENTEHYQAALEVTRVHLKELERARDSLLNGERDFEDIKERFERLDRCVKK